MRVEVAAGVIEQAGQILIAKRPVGIHLSGYWEFPGGKKEHGESWTDCLVRELKEELGVVVAVGRMIFEVEHEYPEKKVALRFYACTIQNGAPEALEVAEVRWVKRGELCQYRFPPADAALLDLLSAP